MNKDIEDKITAFRERLRNSVQRYKKEEGLSGAGYSDMEDELMANLELLIIESNCKYGIELLENLRKRMSKSWFEDGEDTNTQVWINTIDSLLSKIEKGEI